jgi:hypothetical protein
MARRVEERRRCISPEEISKSTFLAMLGPPPPDATPTRAYFEGLLDEQWEIFSFNANTRDVCVRVTSAFGDRTMTITLPYLSNQKP